MKKALFITIIIITAIILTIGIIYLIQNPADPCKQKVRGSCGGRDCDCVIIGYEFDKSTNECIEKELMGVCSIKSAFETLEECQKICVK
jgi:hypothetical protein